MIQRRLPIENIRNVQNFKLRSRLDFRPFFFHSRKCRSYRDCFGGKLIYILNIVYLLEYLENKGIFILKIHKKSFKIWFGNFSTYMQLYIYDWVYKNLYLRISVSSANIFDIEINSLRRFWCGFRGQGFYLVKSVF